MSPRRVLLVLHGAIGDVVRAMPLAMLVRAAWPNAHVAWALEPIAAPLLDGHPAIDERIVFRRDRGAGAFVSFLRTIRSGSFDLVIDLQRHLKSGIVSWASGAPVRLGFHRANSKEMNWLFHNRSISRQEHWSSKVRQYLAFADALGLPREPVRFGLSATHEERARMTARLAGLPRPLIAAFVGSTWPSRFWWPEKTASVLRELGDQLGAGAVLVGARDEMDFATEVTRSAPESTRNLVGETTLRDLVALFEMSAVAFGPDSGPMHIAAATGRPVVSLWGATSPERSAPWGSEHLVKAANVACAPCYLRRCPIDRLCMKEISASEVAALIAREIG